MPPWLWQISPRRDQLTRRVPAPAADSKLEASSSQQTLPLPTSSRSCLRSAPAPAAYWPVRGREPKVPRHLCPRAKPFAERIVEIRIDRARCVAVVAHLLARSPAVDKAPLASTHLQKLRAAASARQVSTRAHCPCKGCGLNRSPPHARAPADAAVLYKCAHLCKHGQRVAALLLELRGVQCLTSKSVTRSEHAEQRLRAWHAQKSSVLGACTQGVGAGITRDTPCCLSHCRAG
jgi:hypothetical protein